MLRRLRTAARSIAGAAPYVGFVLAIAFLSFIAGTFVMHAGAFPSRHLSDAYRGGLALFEQRTRYDNPYPQELWQPARTQARGVTVHDPKRAHEGLTLYTSGHAQRAFLVAMDGEVVHEWHLPFSAVWDETAAVRTPQPDARVYFRKAHLYPNGDLLVIYEGIGDTPWGYGLVKLNKNSEVIWKYLQHVHHDLTVLPDGRIYTLTHEIGTDVIEDWLHLEPPRVDDFVVVLSPEGEELRKVSVLDALVDSPFARLLAGTPWYLMGFGDFLHTNAIDVIDREAAERLPFASEGQVLVSIRELATIAVLDLDKEEVTWAVRGPWIGQHDPDILPNGHMLLFDNHGNFSGGGISRVIEFDPSTLEIVWTYAGDDRHRFESGLRSAQERLPNGNTLITESDGGRLFEVTRAGEIVWNFVNPVRGKREEDGQAVIPIVSWAERVDPKALDPQVLEVPPQVTNVQAGEEPSG